MNEFTNGKTTDGLTVKLWRGERMALIGMDVYESEPDLAGFSIEVQSPGSGTFQPLRNRLNFFYGTTPAIQAVNGYRNYPSTEAPFQKFRWIHFPYDPKGGKYLYRVTKKHMKSSGSLVSGTSITLDISLDAVVYKDFLDVGFTRNFASSQAYADKYKNDERVIPVDATQGLNFKKVSGDVYQWLGFEAYAIEALRIFDHLHFRSRMQDASAGGDKESLVLKKPTAISGKTAWFEEFYVKGSQAENDRKLFSH